MVRFDFVVNEDLQIFLMEVGVISIIDVCLLLAKFNTFCKPTCEFIETN